MTAKRKNKLAYAPPSSVSYATLRHTDDEILSLFKPSVRKWWVDTFGPMRQVNKAFARQPAGVSGGK